MSSSRRLYQRAWFQLTVGIVVTLACLAWALRSMVQKQPLGQVLADIRDAFRTADYRTLPVMLVLVLVFYWLKAWAGPNCCGPSGATARRRRFRR